MIIVKNLTFFFDEQLIFHDLNFELFPGDRLCIIGKSGEGKSILFKLLCGLLPAKQGLISILGMNPYPLTKSFTENIGVVFQNPALIDFYNLWENIGIKDIYENISKEIILERVSKILPLVGLSDRDKEKKVEELSGGMKKRVSIARAIYHQPKILFFDEPHSGLDPINAQMIDHLLLDILHKENILVVVTHDMNSVKFFANKVLLIDNKKGYFFDDFNKIFLSSNRTLKMFFHTH
jgi:phospholipid/cholesterol/gamma-HCH transport system ATP-binding protein